MIEMQTAPDENDRSGNTYSKNAHDRKDKVQDETTINEFDESFNEDKVNLWQLGAGSFVLAAGVILPVMAISIGAMYSFEGIWRLTILHPIETMVEALLILLVPVANYKAWHSLCHNDLRHPIRMGILNGIAIAVPAITFAIATASFALHYPLIDSVNKQPHDLSVGLMGVASLPALCAAVYLTRLLRSAKHTRDAKFRTIVYSLMGIGLTLLSLVAAEARSTYIRIAETMSLSDKAQEREQGLNLLRGSAPEKELKIICADPHAAGLAGMFLPLNLDAQKRLFFAATGKPYRDNQSTNMSLMSNEYLRNHVVGEPIEGLSLHRSAIHGNVHPETLTSSLNWTFVFKNRTYMNQEARAELSLPEGAVISDLTLWVNGKPQEGAFSATEHAGGSYNYIDVEHKDPALITDLGRGRYLLQASPVPGQGELKVQVSITEPLKLDGNNNASFGMPRFIDKNFSLEGQHSIMLRCKDKLLSGLKTVRSGSTADGVNTLAGTLAQESISNSAFTVKLKESLKFETVAVKDPFSKDGRFVIEQLKTRSANTPRHLVVVVDSSQAVADKIGDVISTLKNIPAQIETSIMLAGDKENGEALNREEGIKKLKETKFGGGQDNLFALVKAAEKAGESKGGAVLWIHGTQPGYNNEMYIMAPYASVPSFFEMALDDCLTDTNEFFKNHNEIGPFVPVPRSGPLTDDLNAFFSKWQPGAQETYVDFATSWQNKLPLVDNNEASRAVSVLQAAESVKRLLAVHKTQAAAALGVKYHIVTPVSGAVVLQNQQQLTAKNTSAVAVAFDANGSNSAITEVTSHLNRLNGTAAPRMEGATNGSIGPAGEDATVITGINTAGTVRVNNLANLEALLNILANGTELLGLILGGFNFICGALGKSMIFPFKLSPPKRMLYGFCLAVIGLAIPGCLNWMVASARDANLFS